MKDSGMHHNVGAAAPRDPHFLAGAPLPAPHLAAHDWAASALGTPDTWPAPEADAVLYAYLAEHGPRAIQRAISGGQYSHPEGLFYGGAAPTWSRSARG